MLRHLVTSDPLRYTAYTGALTMLTFIGMGLGSGYIILFVFANVALSLTWAWLLIDSRRYRRVESLCDNCGRDLWSSDHDQWFCRHAIFVGRRKR